MCIYIYIIRPLWCLVGASAASLWSLHPWPCTSPPNPNFNKNLGKVQTRRIHELRDPDLPKSAAMQGGWVVKNLATRAGQAEPIPASTD